MYHFDDEVVKKLVLDAIRNGKVEDEEFRKTFNSLIFDKEVAQQAEEDKLILKAFDEIAQKVPQTEAMQNHYIMSLIAHLTARRKLMGSYFQYTFLRENGIVKKLRPTKLGFKLTKPDDSLVKFNTITRTIKGIDRGFKCLNNFEKRQGKCHENSIDLVRTLSIGDSDIDFVTGYVIRSNPDFKYTHSWVESKQRESGNTIVLDSNLNLIMRKDDYYNFMSAEPSTRVSKAQLEELFSMEVFSKGHPIHHLSSKAFALFAPDIVKLLKEEFGLIFSTFPDEQELQ